MNRLMLASGVAILVILAVILARSQGRAPSRDLPAVSSVSRPSEDSAAIPMTAAEPAELHAGRGTVLVDGTGHSRATARRIQALLMPGKTQPDTGGEVARAQARLVKLR